MKRTTRLFSEVTGQEIDQYLARNDAVASHQRLLIIRDVGIRMRGSCVLDAGPRRRRPTPAGPKRRRTDAYKLPLTCAESSISLSHGRYQVEDDSWIQLDYPNCRVALVAGGLYDASSGAAFLACQKKKLAPSIEKDASGGLVIRRPKRKAQSVGQGTTSELWQQGSSRTWCERLGVVAATASRRNSGNAVDTDQDTIALATGNPLNMASWSLGVVSRVVDE
ncbi:hypothetical protein LX32DRAFT_683598 [Colletotrichum zoysiae]|uniref:Uncharacterized protein n=1 Tax=Colletotrichum zoysiae TaxID=1216348 RepID=A0AAD9M3M6_9PEZI|nr:hypothetical protein LX32DRAFT_683598 [Colletotrichum zoysiae]